MQAEWSISEALGPVCVILLTRHTDQRSIWVENTKIIHWFITVRVVEFHKNIAIYLFLMNPNRHLSKILNFSFFIFFYFWNLLPSFCFCFLSKICYFVEGGIYLFIYWRDGLIRLSHTSVCIGGVKTIIFFNLFLYC